MSEKTFDKVTCRAKEMSFKGEFVYEVPNFDGYLSRPEVDSRCETMYSRWCKLDWMEGYFEICKGGIVSDEFSVKFNFKPLDTDYSAMSWKTDGSISILEDSAWPFKIFRTASVAYRNASSKSDGFTSTMAFSKHTFLTAAKTVNNNGKGSTLRISLCCHAYSYSQLGPTYAKKTFPAVISGQPQINEALRRGAESDFTISCGGHEYPVQRAVMKWASPVFSRMIESGMQETSLNRVEIEDVDPKTLEMVLDFIYNGQIEGVVGANIVDLLYCAEKYELSALKSHCIDSLVTMVSDDNVTQFLSSAIMCNAGEPTVKKLVDYCKDGIFKRRCWQLLKRKEFRAYVEANPEVLNEGKKIYRQ